jgi:hypothetical protein
MHLPPIRAKTPISSYPILTASLAEISVPFVASTEASKNCILVRTHTLSVSFHQSLVRTSSGCELRQ